VGGLVGSPVMIAVSDDTVVGELIKVRETVLDDDSSDVGESDDVKVENIVLLTAAEPEGVL
jgi:hypothetical protein